MTDISPTPLAPVTWLLDTMMTTIDVKGGTALPGHRVLVNNRQTAHLYNRGSGTPVASLTEASYREVGGRWIITGFDSNGERVEWSAAKVQKRSGCSSCGGGRR